MSAIFMPFPKTNITNHCIDMGLLKSDYSFNDMPNSFITHSVLDIKDKDIMERLQKVSSLAIQFPILKEFLIFLAKNVKFNQIHFVIYLIGTILRFKEERKLNLFEALYYAWSYRKNV